MYLGQTIETIAKEAKRQAQGLADRALSLPLPVRHRNDSQTAHSAPRSLLLKISLQISALYLTVNMSKRQIKAQASSSRAASGAFGLGFGSTSTSTFGATSSPLSYVTEPPDLSSISDPNVVVAFKNLSKKDSTTKAKALEDIQTYVSSLSGQVEEAVLEAWVGLLLGCTYLANSNFGFLSDQDLSSYIHR